MSSDLELDNGRFAVGRRGRGGKESRGRVETSGRRKRNEMLGHLIEMLGPTVWVILYFATINMSLQQSPFGNKDSGRLSH